RPAPAGSPPTCGAAGTAAGQPRRTAPELLAATRGRAGTLDPWPPGRARPRPPGSPTRPDHPDQGTRRRTANQPSRPPTPAANPSRAPGTTHPATAPAAPVSTAPPAAPRVAYRGCCT